MKTCVTCSVNYSDFLGIFLKHNHPFFDETYVLTTPDDVETHKVCQDSEDVELIKTEDFYVNGDKFNYGNAFHHLFKTFTDKDWVFLMDADTIFPEGYERNFEVLTNANKDIFWGANRYLLNTYEDYQAFLNGKRVFDLDRSWGMGYLQIFNIKNKFLNGNLHYENSLSTKHFTDFLFRLKFGWHVFREDSGEHYYDLTYQKCLPPVYHVGKIGNDSNRTSEKFAESTC